VATIGRLLKNIGLIAEYRSLLWGSFAKETYHFKEPTNRRQGWRADARSLSSKIQVSFEKEPYKGGLYFAKETCIFLIVLATRPRSEEPTWEESKRPALTLAMHTYGAAVAWSSLDFQSEPGG